MPLLCFLSSSGAPGQAQARLAAAAAGTQPSSPSHGFAQHGVSQGLLLLWTPLTDPPQQTTLGHIQQKVLSGRGRLIHLLIQFFLVRSTGIGHPENFTQRMKMTVRPLQMLKPWRVHKSTFPQWTLPSRSSASQQPE